MTKQRVNIAHEGHLDGVYMCVSAYECMHVVCVHGVVHGVYAHCVCLCVQGAMVIIIDHIL